MFYLAGWLGTVSAVWLSAWVAADSVLFGWLGWHRLGAVWLGLLAQAWCCLVGFVGTDLVLLGWVCWFRRVAVWLGLLVQTQGINIKQNKKIMLYRSLQ